MQHLPLFADLAQRAVLVVGGGVVAERRVTMLLEAKARVTVLAPQLSVRLTEVAAAGTITHLARAYDNDPLDVAVAGRRANAIICHRLSILPRRVVRRSPALAPFAASCQ